MAPLSMLSNSEVEAIHQATLQILSETGILLSQPKAVSLLLDAGATANPDAGRVYLPAHLVEKAIAACPSQVSLRGRGGKVKTLGDGNLYWHNLGGARDVLDWDAGSRSVRLRPALMQDVRHSARLLDALDSVTTVTPFFTPQDAPGELMSLAMYRHSLPHTTKPLQGPGLQTAADVRAILRMAEVIGPPVEVLSLSVSPISPLFFPDDAAEAILEIAEAGAPFGPLPCPTAGTTAPMSIAGAVAQQNAEVLACIVLAQLVHPGLPIIYCGRLAMMEPRTGVSVWGGVELGLVSAATVQVAHRYGLPVNVYGLSTNSHTLDIQNGYERALNAILPCLAGADELSGIGEMEAGVMGSYAQMVCDNEIAASVQRIRKGIAVNQDSLAVELIAEVMEGSRNFIDQRHTSRYLRAGEVFITRLAERRPFEIWEKDQCKGMTERAFAEAERLIHTHEVPPLDAAQERALDEIMESAWKEMS